MNIPAWESLHPLVVHFPIALLLVAPVFVVLTLLFPGWKSGLGAAALVLMVLGTGATYLASATGEAAEDQAEGNVPAEAVLENHEELAEATRLSFTGLTLIYAVILLLPLAVKRELPRVPSAVVGLAFLLLYAGGGLLLADVGHQGARLVHEYGVRAPMVDSAGSVAASVEAMAHEEQENDE